jgi:DNA-binding MltR family transcriptional regulator
MLDKFVGDTAEWRAFGVQVSALLRKESPRGCILVGGAFIDETLKTLLSRYFIEEPRLSPDKPTPSEKLVDINGPLGPFSARINLCRALDLIDADVWWDLDQIRGIRNDAAHFKSKVGLEIQFDKGSIADRILSLKCLHDEAKPFFKPNLRGAFETWIQLFAGFSYSLSSHLKLARDQGKLHESRALVVGAPVSAWLRETFHALAVAGQHAVEKMSKMNEEELAAFIDQASKITPEQFSDALTELGAHLKAVKKPTA